MVILNLTMPKFPVIGLALAFALGGLASAQHTSPKNSKDGPAARKAPLRLLHTTLLPGIDGDFDHFGVDLQGNRLFLTAEDHSSVEVFDLKGKHIRSISGFKTPHYVRYLPDQNKLLVVDGGAGEIKFLKGDTYQPIDSVKVLLDADSSVFDSSANILYNVNGGKDAGNLPYSNISIIDAKQDNRLGDVRIESKTVEALGLEKSGKRLFANATANNQLVVIDRDKRTILSKWPISAGERNVPMALDEANRRLFVVTRTNPHFIVLDMESGNQVAALPAGEGTDDMFFDEQHKRIYASAREGIIFVYEQKDADHYELIAKVASAPGGKTSLFIPELNRYYVAVSRAEGKKQGAKVAKIQIFSVQ